MGRGGARLGAGRKPKSAVQNAVDGTKSYAQQPNYFQAGAKLPEVEEFDAPNELTTDERNVWMKLAPGAFKARTLSQVTEYAFVLLCKNIVLEQGLRASVEKCGGPDHRGILQKVEGGLTAFSLRAMGKPLILDEKEKPKSALERLQAQTKLRAVK